MVLPLYFNDGIRVKRVACDFRSLPIDVRSVSEDFVCDDDKKFHDVDSG